MDVISQIPFNPAQCPRCKNYSKEKKGCTSYGYDSQNNPIFATFLNESDEECPYFQDKAEPVLIENLSTERKHISDDTSDSTSGTGNLPVIKSTQNSAANENASVNSSPELVTTAQIFCIKCKNANKPEQTRCVVCGANLLPGEGFLTRLAAFIIILALSAAMEWFVYTKLFLSHTELPFCTSPTVMLIIIPALPIFGFVNLVRKTPTYTRYVNRADRHIKLSLLQAKDDLTRAIELAPEKEKANLLKKRANVYEALKMEDEATRDLIAYTYETGAYRTGATLTEVVGGDGEIYAQERAKSERSDLLKSGRAVAVGFCSKCKDAVVLDHQYHCLLHPHAKIHDTRLCLPDDHQSVKQQILEVRKKKSTGCITRLVVFVLAFLALIFAVKIMFLDKGKEINHLISPTQVISTDIVGSEPIMTKTVESTQSISSMEFHENGYNFVYPSNWELITDSEINVLLNNSLKGLEDYDYLGGVFQNGLNNCDECASFVVLEINGIGTKGPVTPEMYGNIKTNAESSMGTRLISHEFREFTGIPAAYVHYIGKSQETENFDITLLVPDEERMVMLSCSTSPQRYSEVVLICQNILDSMTFDFYQISTSQTGDNAGEFHITVTPNVANIRSGPGTTYEIVASLKKGDTAAVEGRNNDGKWLKISDPSGWISSDLVSCNVSIEELPITE